MPVSTLALKPAEKSAHGIGDFFKKNSVAENISLICTTTDYCVKRKSIELKNFKLYIKFRQKKWLLQFSRPLTFQRPINRLTCKTLYLEFVLAK